MIDSELIEKLKERYPNIHPLIFHRSVEHAKSNGELFDILDSFPTVFPVVWNEQERRWASVKELQNPTDFMEELE